jgi:hypothetical protein
MKAFKIVILLTLVGLSNSLWGELLFHYNFYGTQPESHIFADHSGNMRQANAFEYQTGTLIESSSHSAEGFAERHEKLLTSTFGMTPEEFRAGIAPAPPDGTHNVFGAYSSMLLRLGLQTEAANRTLRSICASMGKVRDRNGRAVTGENFTALELARAYCATLGTDFMEEDTRKAIREVFRTFDFSPPFGSENHFITSRVARYLMAQHMPDDFFAGYGKATGSELVIIDGKALKEFIRYRAQTGWGEFDSGAYQALSYNIILTLYDLSEDEELRQLVGMMANLMLADAAVDTLDGIYGGARGRVMDQVRNQGVGTAKEDKTKYLQYMYFGIKEVYAPSGSSPLLTFSKLHYWQRSREYLLSSFRPMDIVVDIALGRDEPYENRERKHLHNTHDPIPEVSTDGSIRKYTYYTPSFIMGSVQWQDPYPAGHPGAGYAKHQQYDGGLSIPRGTSTHIYVHHPGDNPQHGYWVGDWGCLCHETFQHKSVQLSMFKIPENQKYQFIHAYLPIAKFDEVAEAEGWIFVRCGDVFAALYLSDGYEWTLKGKWAGEEVISRGSRKAAILEAAEASDFESFADFRNRILENEVWFDPEAMSVRYRSLRGDRVEMDYKGERIVNGELYDLDYNLYDSTYMQSEWRSGVVQLFYGNDSVVLDFNHSPIEKEELEKYE